jgi:hypothetical protein
MRDSHSKLILWFTSDKATQVIVVPSVVALLAQLEHPQLQDYLKHFQNTVDVIEHTGGIMGKLPGLEGKLLQSKGKTLAQMMIEERAALPLESQERYLAMAFMLSANQSHYGCLLEDNLSNE